MSNKQLAKKAAGFMSSLYVFDAVVGALENGTIIGDIAETAASEIINIAKKAQADLLDEYDLVVNQIKE